jgi:hypothetical protein
LCCTDATFIRAFIMASIYLGSHDPFTLSACPYPLRLLRWNIISFYIPLFLCSFSNVASSFSPTAPFPYILDNFSRIYAFKAAASLIGTPGYAFYKYSRSLSVYLPPSITSLSRWLDSWRTVLYILSWRLNSGSSDFILRGYTITLLPYPSLSPCQYWPTVLPFLESEPIYGVLLYIPYNYSLVTSGCCFCTL